MTVNTGERAACDVAHHITACTLGREASPLQRVNHFGQALDGKPVQLDVLAHGDVSLVAGVDARQFRHGA